MLVFPEKGRGFITVCAVTATWSPKMRENSKKKVMKRRDDIYTRIADLSRETSRGGGADSAPQPF